MTRTKKSKETSPSDQPSVVNGWTLYAHPLLLDQLEKLINAVEKERQKNPATYKSAANTKVLAALHKLVFETIPQDPTRSEYRQGNTLGNDRKHWFRAKFGGQRFRLFFRYHSQAKIIIYAWVNDSNTLRTYRSKTDAYVVFSSMLDNGNPPESWEKLLVAAKESTAIKRLRAARAPRGIRP